MGRNWGASPGGLVVKNSPAMQERWVPSLGGEDPMEKGMATHSGILAWRIPWTEEPGGIQSMGSQRVGHNWSDVACTTESKSEETLREWERERDRVREQSWHFEPLDPVEPEATPWASKVPFCLSVLDFWYLESSAWANTERCLFLQIEKI